MCSRKCVGPRMEPWGSPALTDALVKTFYLEPLKVVFYWEKKKKGQISDLKFDELCLLSLLSSFVCCNNAWEWSYGSIISWGIVSSRELAIGILQQQTFI